MPAHSDDRALTGRRLPLAEARELAHRNGWREKALAYITRRPNELLVFAHTAEYPDAGIQVPGGGVEPGETPGEAVIREVSEETGLRLDNPLYLASFEWQREAPSKIRHYFWLEAARETPDSWTHRVSAGVEDKGMTFLFNFVPLNGHGLIGGFGYEAALNELPMH